MCPLIKRLGICTTYCNNSLFNGTCFMLSGWNVEMLECWNVDLNKEVTHLLTSVSIGILPILHLVQDKLTHCCIFPEPIIPSFQYSNCERNELSSYPFPLILSIIIGKSGRCVNYDHSPISWSSLNKSKKMREGSSWNDLIKDIKEI